MGCAESRKRRDEVDAARRVDRPRKFGCLQWVVDKAHRVQPLDGGPGDENRAFECVLDGFAGELKPDGRQEAVFGLDGFGARVHQVKRTSPVGVFGVTLVETGLSEQCGLLVAECPRDGHLRVQESVEVGVAVQLFVRGWANLRQHRPGNAELRQQLVVPRHLVDVVQHRPSSVGDICDVVAGQIVDEPGVDRSEQQIARLGPVTDGFRTCPLELYGVGVVENPLDFRRRKVGVGFQPGCLTNHLRSVVVEFLDAVYRPPVLPDQRVVDWLATLFVPDDGRLALVRDAKRFDLCRVDICRFEAFGHDLLDALPDLDWVVFDPTGFRIELFVLVVGVCDHLSGVIEQHEPCTGGSLVDGTDVRSGHYVVSGVSLWLI